MERWFAAAALAAVMAVAGCDRIGGGGGDGKDAAASTAGGEAAEADSAGAEELGSDVSVDTQKVAVDSAKQDL